MSLHQRHPDDVAGCAASHQSAPRTEPHSRLFAPAAALHAGRRLQPLPQLPQPLPPPPRLPEPAAGLRPQQPPAGTPSQLAAAPLLLPGLQAALQELLRLRNKLHTLSQTAPMQPEAPHASASAQNRCLASYPRPLHNDSCLHEACRCTLRRWCRCSCRVGPRSCSRCRRQASRGNRGRHRRGLRLDVFRRGAALAVRVEQQHLHRISKARSCSVRQAGSGGAWHPTGMSSSSRALPALPALQTKPSTACQPASWTQPPAGSRKQTRRRGRTHSCPPTVKRSLAIGSPSPIPFTRL